MFSLDWFNFGLSNRKSHNMIQELLVILTLLVVGLVTLRKIVQILRGKESVCKCEKGKCDCCNQCVKTFQMKTKNVDK